jgi:TrmH family RNA methyltransferase
MTEAITSAANPLVKRMRLLADRRARRREEAFVVEGVQPVWRAVEAGWQIETLIVATDLLGDAAAAMVADQQARGVRVARLSTELFGRVSGREGPSGLAAIVRCREHSAADLAVTAGAVFVALHEIGNPGNLGTVIRTADATGSAGVILIGDTADPFAPTAVKASMGSLFGVKVARLPDAAAFLDWARAHAVTVIATSGNAPADHWSVRYRPPLTILLGSEGRGLPEDLLAGADECVRIPMTGTPESLNLAVAAGVMLYEVRRRLAGPGG